MLLTFEVFGETQISRELVRFGARAIDAKPAFEEIGQKMQEDISQLFDSEGSTGAHGHWAPLQPDTIARKQNAGLSTMILQATEALKNSLTGETEDSMYEVDHAGIVLGTKLDYGAMHYAGSDKVPYPARRPVDFTEMNKRGYVKILQEYIMEGM